MRTQTVKVTASNEHDVTKVPELIREDDEVVYGDSGYQEIEKREEIKTAPNKSKMDYRINERRGKVNSEPERIAREVERESEKEKSASHQCAAKWDIHIVFMIQYLTFESVK